MSFVHLHVHTNFSLLNSSCRIKELVLYAKKIGQKAIAITDSGNMYGVVKFYKYCVKEGLKPIIGCEMYVAPRLYSDKIHGVDDILSKLVLLCENEEGYNNLVKLVSFAHLYGHFHLPRIDCSFLQKYHSGLIGLSGGINGVVQKALLTGSYELAKKQAMKFAAIMGKNNFFIELQNHGIREEKIISESLIKIYNETGIKLVATNDVHYIHRRDAQVHRVLYCIKHSKMLRELSRYNLPNNEFNLKTEREMRSLFSNYEYAIENTNFISRRCNLKFKFGEIKIPKYINQKNISSAELLKRIATQGMIKIYGKKPENNIIERFKYELKIVQKMGYSDYFLIVHDYVKYAKSIGVAVGPGRGSGAGSLLAYCLGITSVDPIRYGLLFERFLNPGRVTMPDFDIDFCNERRHEVIDYVVRKYGKGNVCRIITFGSLAARAAIRDVGRVMGLEYKKVDMVAKTIPGKPGTSLKLVLSQNERLRKMLADDFEIEAMFKMACKIEGIPRNVSTHAAAVVITDSKIYDYLPVTKSNDIILTQYTMDDLADLGILKMDFLGLRNLTIIKKTEELINKSAKLIHKNFSSLNDIETYKMISKGECVGVFQLESDGMRRMLSRIKPYCFEDLIACISLYRPGPSQFIEVFIKNRHKNLVNISDKLNRITASTYGVIIYQEQVIQIFREMAGYSYARADLVRRAISKKRADIIQREKKFFVYGKINKAGEVECSGAIENGFSEKQANYIFEKIVKFGSYAFNKSHAAAYSVIAYKTAYLKCYFPVEYMVSLLNSVIENREKLVKYIIECKRMNIKICQPNINSSDCYFKIISKNLVEFGLLAVKGIGKNLIDNILKERKKNKFESLEDFIKRIIEFNFNKESVVVLIKSGAFDSLEHNRKKLVLGIDKIMNKFLSRKAQLTGQMSFFMGIDSDRFVYPKTKEYSDIILRKMEIEVLGISLEDMFS